MPRPCRNLSLGSELLHRKQYAAEYTQTMADESVLDEIQDNCRESAQRLRASLNLMRSQGMTEDDNYADLTTQLRTALAMTEAAYSEARRRREM